MWIFCGYPTDDAQRDLVEIERVWQHMKAYSLYTAQVPSHQQALEYGDPAALLASIPDTMRGRIDTAGHRVAGYYAACPSFVSQACIDCAPKRKASTAQQPRSVAFRRLTNLTAYVRIDSFIPQTHEELRLFDTAVAGVQNLIVDLYGNPGGSLDACTASVEMFLPAGVPYLYCTYRRRWPDTDTVEAVIWRSGRTGQAWEGKRIAVVMNGGTASAAEIMAAALRYGLGPTSVVLVGQASYGKAIGQYTFCLWRSSSAFLVLTGFRFVPIAGAAYDYHEKGIMPDVAIAGSYWNMIAAAGERLEPGFESRIDTTFSNLFRKSSSAQRSVGPAYCYAVLPELSNQ